jgi:hypothetical protein
MTGPESPDYERWDLAAKPPGDVTVAESPPPAGPSPPRRAGASPDLPVRFAFAALAAGLIAATCSTPPG